MIEGVEIDVGRDAVWLRSAAPLRVLASAVVGGALDVTRHVVNMHVRGGYDSADPGADLRTFARSLGITEPFVGLMTAAEGALPSSPDAICRARRVLGAAAGITDVLLEGAALLGRSCR